MDIAATRRLLNQVSGFARTQKKLDQLSGTNFNVFRILGLETKEVRTHSAFLGELLNPTGSHGLGDTFLKLFTEAIGFSSFVTKDAKMVVEKYIGQIDTDYQQGGRIDIYLESTGEYIFIENKIYASDQQNQLARYHRYRDTARLIYLTLNGSKPTEWGAGELLPEQYELRSYEVDITNWLIQCHSAAAAHPIVRETIVQYLHLVNQLTGLTPNNFMMDETKQLLLQDYASFESALYCKNLIDEINRDVERALETEVRQTWHQVFPGPVCQYENCAVTLGVNYDSSGFYYGFRVESVNQGEAVPMDVSKLLTKEALKVDGRYKTSSYFLAWGFFQDIRHMGQLSAEQRFKLTDKDKRAALVRSMLDEATGKCTQFVANVNALK